MDEEFLHIGMFSSPWVMERLAVAHVVVFGPGGVGSWCAEALARPGTGVLTLANHDTVGLTDLNRQVEAIRFILGQPKVQVMADRTRDTNPDCHLITRAEKYEAGWREDFFDQPLDYIVDCIDLVSCKLGLIETALTWGVPIVSFLGTGNKSDPGLFHITDLSKTEGCPLVRVVYKELRARDILHHRVLWSSEEPEAALQRETSSPDRRSVPGSAIWVPPVAGLMLVGEVVLSFAGLHI